MSSPLSRITFALSLLALAPSAQAACTFMGNVPAYVQCVSDLASTNEQAVSANASDISANAADISANAADISANAADISANAADISANATGVATNAAGVAANSASIAANADDIAANQASLSTDIALNADDIGATLDLICELAEDVKGQLSASSSLIDVCDLHFTAFVTSTTQAGDLGGVDGGDAICQSLADSAGLEGTFRAWLSDSTRDPASSFAGHVPYRLVDGTQIAVDTEDLYDSALGADINLDETGAAVPGPAVLSNVWTGTNADGALRSSGQTCLDWTSADPSNTGHAGRTNRDNDDWTSTSNESCDDLYHLYCFEQ